jgi:diguanylate cyclase (GGDEF)-like protein
MAKERSEKVHRAAATIDPLTEIFNRRALMDSGRRVLARIAWDKQPVAVLMFDLDHFKKINDRFGHAIGDEALKLFARTASAKLRATDIIGRLGGEEFAAVLPATNLASAALAADRVRVAFEEAAKEVEGLPVEGTVSIGASATDDADCNIDVLLAMADKALYAAKSGGRNCIVQYSSELEESAMPAELPERSLPVEDRRNVTLAPNELSLAIAAARATLKPAV